MERQIITKDYIKMVLHVSKYDFKIDEIVSI